MSYHTKLWNPIYQDIQKSISNKEKNELIAKNMVKLYDSCNTELELYNNSILSELVGDHIIFENDSLLNKSKSKKNILFTIPFLVALGYNAIFYKKLNFINLLKSYHGKVALLAGAGLFFLADRFNGIPQGDEQKEEILYVFALTDSLRYKATNHLI